MFFSRLVPREFNSYGSRRGNDAVMARGTFANIRLVNKFIGKAGPKTIHFPSDKEVLRHVETDPAQLSLALQAIKNLCSHNHKTVSALLGQRCGKSDIPVELVTSCEQFVTTWGAVTIFMSLPHRSF